MKLITYEDIPRWYGLLWEIGSRTLVVSVHPGVIGCARVVRADSPIASQLSKKFGFKRFEGSLAKPIGFDGALSRRENNGSVEFRARTPRIVRLLDEPCESCRGSKRDRWWDDRACLNCDGTGRKKTYEWQRAHAVSASLNLLFMVLADFAHNHETTSGKPQLLTVGGLVTDTDMRGGSIFGEFGVPLVRWLAQHPHYTTFPAVNEAMMRAHRFMFRERKQRGTAGRVSDGRFSSRVSQGGFFVTTCPGDACGINPNHNAGYDINRDRGYKFSCHNVDTVAQQFTLLAGLAALHDLADQALYGASL